MLLAHGNILDMIVLALVVVISIVLHELAHGYVAKWNGDYTAKVNGRLTLNPIAHFDLLGFIMMFTVGFGFAKPVPINPNNFTNRKKGIFTVAIAGITLNFILAFFSFGFYDLFVWLRYITQIDWLRNVLLFFRQFFYYMTVINLNLMIFNILPIYPLDGFRIVEAFTRYNNRFCKFMRDYGSYILFALILLGVIISYLPVPQYFDIMGTYITFFQSLLIRALDWFWGLIFFWVI